MEYNLDDHISGDVAYPFKKTCSISHDNLLEVTS
jgi:hypothetical protein